MLFIVSSHLAVHGVINTADVVWKDGSAVNKLFSSGLMAGGGIGVALFAMLTGYFLIYNDKINLKKIVCESVYYGLFATLLFIISYALGYRFDDISSLISLLKYVVGDAILPISKGNWWFVTAYVLIVLLHPLINKLFMKLNEKGCIVAILAIWFVYTLGTFLDTTFYSVHELALFYCMGAYIRKYNVLGKVTMKKGYRFVMCVMLILSIGMYALLTSYGFQMSTDSIINKGISKIITFFVCGSVIVPLSSFIIFSLIGNLKCKPNSVINTIAASTLGVYMIHESAVARSVIWHGLLKVDKLYMGALFPIYALVCIIIVFSVCSFLDIIRLRFIEPKMIGIFNRCEAIFVDNFLVE